MKIEFSEVYIGFDSRLESNEQQLWIDARSSPRSEILKKYSRARLNHARQSGNVNNINEWWIGAKVACNF